MPDVFLPCLNKGDDDDDDDEALTSHLVDALPPPRQLGMQIPSGFIDFSSQDCFKLQRF